MPIALRPALVFAGALTAVLVGMAAAQSPSALDCEREIVQLHDFLADWFTGEIGPDGNDFRYFERAIGADFSMVSPSGATIERSSVIEGVRSDHGRWRGDAAASIEIRNVTLAYSHGDVVVATYEEWQASSQGESARTSTVVFRRNAALPNGLEWVHLHETWIER